MSSIKKNLFRGSSIAAVTAYGSATPITGITAANPAVVSKTSHGLADNDVVRIAAVVGMTELNGKLFVVEALGADTFSLIGIDSTGYNAYVSGGTFEKATFTTACELTDYGRQSGSTPEIDGTTICSTAAEFDFGIPDPGSVTLSYKSADTAVQNALEASRANATPIALRVQYPGGTNLMFDIGTITQTSDSGQLAGHWSGSATLRRTRNRVDVTA